MVVVVVVFGLALGSAWRPGLTPRNQLADAVYALTSTTNVARAFEWGGDSSYLGHCWSLAIEEQFYLIWPVALGFVLSRFDLRRLVMGLVVVILLITAWRAALAWGGASRERIYFGFDTRADALFYGCLLALVGIDALPGVLVRLWWMPAGLLALFVLLGRWYSPWLSFGGYSGIALLSAWLIVCSLRNDRALGRALRHPVTQWIGLRSYSLYLWHLPVLRLLEISGWRLRIVVPLAIFPIALVAELSYRLVELRFARLRPVDPA